jgi:hypothetical protein
MSDRIVTGSDGRKYITNEPLLHTRTYTQAELDAASAAERERCAKLCEAEAALWRDLQDITDFKLCAARIRAG